MNRKIYGLGEIVYDIFFKENNPIEARPGGAILNMLISLSRLGLPVSIIADMVQDKVGNLIHEFLIKNKIDESFIFWHHQGRSRLALAFLNNNNDAEYLFYKMQHEVIPDFNFPKLTSNDVLLFGSYYAIKPLIRQRVSELIQQSNEQGTFILYDPNFRKSHLEILEEVRPFIVENIALSHITKASVEDCELIWQTSNPEEIATIFKSLGGKYLILTRASQSVLLFTPDSTYEFPVEKIKPISTVGAGDAFMAGLTYALYALNVEQKTLSYLDEKIWEKIINTAIKLSSKVCLTYDNYIPIEEVQSILIP